MANVILRLALSILLVGFLVTAAISQEKQIKRVELKIEASGGTFRSDQEIMLKLTFRNDLDKTVTLLVTSSYRDYKWTVKGQKGGDVSPTEFGQRMFANAEITRRFLKKLNPGESIQNEVPINKLFSMTKPDDYYITTKRVVYTGESMKGPVEVVSNTLRISVINPDALPRTPK